MKQLHPTQNQGFEQAACIYQYLYLPNDIKKSIFTVGNVNFYATTLKNKIPIQLDRDLKSWFMVYMVEQQTGRGVETLPSE